MTDTFYSVELFEDGQCTSTKRLDHIQQAQDIYDSWQSDFENDTGIEIRLYKFEDGDYSRIK